MIRLKTHLYQKLCNFIFLIGTAHFGKMNVEWFADDPGHRHTGIQRIVAFQSMADLSSIVAESRAMTPSYGATHGRRVRWVSISCSNAK